MILNHTKSLLLVAVSTLTFSLNASANTYINPESNKYLLFEAGGSYSYAIYKDSYKSPESYTLVTPNGFSTNPSSVSPNNFYGGYIGLSLLRDSLLFNSRYDMYASQSKSNSRTGTKITLAPVKLTFSVDKVWGCFDPLAYGAGLGVVIATLNQGKAFTNNTHQLANGQYIDPIQGESIQGRTRIDPLIEAFIMYRITNNVNIKLNAGYQIPVNSTFTNGSANVNLGVNYALPI